MASTQTTAADDSHSALVWVPSILDVFRKASIVESLEDSRIKVRYEDGTDDIVSSKLIGEVNPRKFDKADDIAELTFLNEGSVLHNLESRYRDGMIYTYSGLFLVAINPYSKLPIYSQDYIDMYHNVPKENTKPHIFAETDQAYQNLLTERKDQSILVTGESGAGKTENTKKIIRYLAAVTSKHNTTTDSFEEQIIQANPILEAFGNAQTVRNNNSSRFGKFIKIEFDEKGKISGAHIDWYLLEKSRVVHQSKNERNYHIFYQLLAGMSDEELMDFGLERSPERYSYLKHANSKIPGVDDAKEFKTLKRAFEIMNIKKSQYDEVLKVIAVILHLGNIEFTSMKAEQASFKSSVEKLSNLLGVSPAALSEAVLTPKVKAGKEFVQQTRNAMYAKFSIDALSKSLYEKLFKFLVDSINKNLGSNDTSSNFIGVLDIAGFEIFKDNSFEQLCINYTNEKLQQFFNHHMFVLEQNEYLREDINWKFIDFGQDLQQTIELIEKRSNPIGIFSILDEECIVPKSTDESFFEKLNQHCKEKCGKFKPSKFSSKFTLKHYAGDVEYSVEGWINKNKDPLAESVLNILSGSTNSFIADIYPTSTEQRSSLSFRTVSQKHREQLNSLVDLLSQTHPHFVRCIIPNHKKKPHSFDKRLVLEQLKCNGVLEGIRIVRSGFPNRVFFKEFYDRYKVLAPKANFTNNLKTNCNLILCGVHLDSNLYRVGSTKLFFKAGVLADLELKRDHVIKTTFTRFNSICRGMLQRKATETLLLKSQAAQVLANAFNSYNELSDNKWFALYASIRPLLNSSQQLTKTKKLNERIKLLENELKDMKVHNMKLVEKCTTAVEAKENVILESQADKRDLQDLKEEIAKYERQLCVVESERDDQILIRDQITAKLESFEKEFQAGKDLINVLENEKVQLTGQIKILEENLNRTQETQKSGIEESVSIENELKMLKTLLATKETLITELKEKLSKSNDVMEEKFLDASSKYSSARAEIKTLIEENKSLSSKLQSLENSSSQYGTVATQKERDLEHLKDLLLKQSHQIKLLQNEREKLRKSECGVDDRLKLVNSEMAELQCRYKQLEYEAKEAKEFLQKKISDEIKFNRGKQTYQDEISGLRAEVRRLEKEITFEKSAKTQLVKEISELKREVEGFENQRRVSDMRLAQGGLRIRSTNGIAPELEAVKDDKNQLIKEYSSLTLQLNEVSARLKKETIENARLKADMKLLHTRLASETFDKQQLKIRLNKIRVSTMKGEVPSFEDDQNVLIRQNESLHNQIRALEIDLDLERKASRRSQAPRHADKPALKESTNAVKQASVTMTNNYKSKYEKNETQVRLSERQGPKEDQSGQLLHRSEIDDSQKGLLAVYQESCKSLFEAREELSQLHLENMSLQKNVSHLQKDISEHKNNKVEAMVYQLAREELAKAQLKLEAVESKNRQLSESVKLFKSRAEEYFSKLENAESAVRDCKYSEKLYKERLTEANESNRALKKEVTLRETTIIKLSSSIGQLREESASKSTEISKISSSNRFLQDELEHCLEKSDRDISALKKKLEAQINKLSHELTQSLRNETDLRKTWGSFEVEFNRMKEKKSQEISDLIKEKTHLTRTLNDLNDQNENFRKSQKDLEMKLKSLLKQIETLNHSFDSLIIERDNLQSSKTSLEEQVKVLTSEYSKFDNERENHQSTVGEMNRAIDKYDGEIENLKIEIKKGHMLRDKLNSVIDQERQKNIAVMEENQTLGKYAQSLKEKIEELEEKMASMDDDAVWKERIDKLEKELKLETLDKVRLEESNNGLEQAIEDLRDRSDKQHEQIKNQESVKLKYESKISELFEAIHKWQTADSKNHLIIKRAEREVRHLKENSMELEAELNDWKKRFDTISMSSKNTDEIFI